MPNYLLNVLLTLILSFVATGVNAASFDCKLAQGKVETMICGDSGLSILDEQLNVAFTQIRTMSGDERTEKAMQRAWLKARNGCVDLERLTKPLDVPPTDERAGKRQERLMHVCSPLISNAQSAEAM